MYLPDFSFGTATKNPRSLEHGKSYKLHVIPLKKRLTLSPINMVQWKMAVFERQLLLEIYPFSLNHDYWRKGKRVFPPLTMNGVLM